MGPARDPLVKVYSEFPLAYYGGGERFIINLSNAFISRNVPTSIVENSCSRVLTKVTDDFIKTITRVQIRRECFHRVGYTKYFVTFLPNLSNNDMVQISLIFIRRVPKKSYLRKIDRGEQKVVFCLHGIALEQLRLTNPLIMVHQIIIRSGLRRLAGFLNYSKAIYAQTLTPLTNDYLRIKGASRNSLFTIENGIKVENGMPERVDEFFQVIFLGRIENLSKGIGILRKVIEISHTKGLQIRFVIIGSGSDEKMLHNLPKNATYQSFVSESIKNHNLAKSNLMIVTSNLDPFPVVPMEGLIYGLPIVTTPSSGPSYVVSKNRIFGKISTFRPADIVSDINSYYTMWMNDKSRYYELKSDIARSAKGSFSENSMIMDYLKMVRNVSSGRNI